jgi:hypothetical protein
VPYQLIAEELRSLLAEALERINAARVKIMDALDREPLSMADRHRLVVALGKLNMAFGLVEEARSKL